MVARWDDYEWRVPGTDSAELEVKSDLHVKTVVQQNTGVKLTLNFVQKREKRWMTIWKNFGQMGSKYTPEERMCQYVQMVGYKNEEAAKLVMIRILESLASLTMDKAAAEEAKK
eukprot:9495991-Pyramimonas_sp.AAC.1